MEHQSILLGFARMQNHGNDTFFIRVLEADYSMRPPNLNSSNEVAWIFLLMRCLLLLIGSYFKYILYSYLLEQYTQKEWSSINKLILISAIIQHANIINACLYNALVMTSGRFLLAHARWYCTLSMLLFQFSLC